MIGNARDLSIHDNVTVEADLHGLPVTLGAFVTNVLSDELWLATRLPDERIGRLHRGQSIHLTFDRDGPVVLDSTFVRRLGEGGRFDMQRSRVFAVRRPAGLESGQRRAHVRVEMDRDVRIRSLGAAEPDRLGIGRTINIGAGGVLFETSMPLLFGEDLTLAIVLGSRNIVIAGGAIVRIEDAGQGPADGPADGPAPPPVSRVAVRFDRISEADQERITCYILQVHRQRRSSEASADAGSAAGPADPAARRDGSAAGPADPAAGRDEAASEPGVPGAADLPGERATTVETGTADG
jgi:c-di-GMP-binding flagellar brake protein YcgR